MTLIEQFESDFGGLAARFHDVQTQVERLSQSVVQDGWNPDRAAEILGALEEISQKRMGIDEVFRALPSEIQKSAKVQGRIQEATQIVKKLLVAIDKLENSARAERDSLRPQINASVRMFQMNQAYQAQAIR